MLPSFPPWISSRGPPNPPVLVFLASLLLPWDWGIEEEQLFLYWEEGTGNICEEAENLVERRNLLEAEELSFLPKIVSLLR